MKFEVEGRIYHSNIGEELFIPANAIHSARNIGEIIARWLYGILNKYLLWAFSVFCISFTPNEPYSYPPQTTSHL